MYGGNGILTSSYIISIKSFKNIFTLCFSHRISNDWGDQSEWLDQQQWTAKKLPIWLLRGSNFQKIPLDIKVPRKIGKDQKLDIRSSNLLVNWVHTWKLSKILHDHIFVPKILHTKNAWIGTNFVKNKTAEISIWMIKNVKF